MSELYAFLKMKFYPHLTEPDSQNRQKYPVFFATVIGVVIKKDDLLPHKLRSIISFDAF